MTVNVSALLPGYITEFMIDVERMLKYPYVAYVVSPLRTTLAAHYVRLYQELGIKFEQALDWVDILPGSDMGVRLSIKLPVAGVVSEDIAKELEKLGFGRASESDLIHMLK